MGGKFSRPHHAFRVPDVCKKKRPPGGEPPSGDPDPADPVDNWYDVDVTWWIFHYVFSGTLTLNKQYDHHWASHTVPPANGEAATFDWFPGPKTFSAWLAHYVAGVQRVALQITNEPYPANPNFDTGIFVYLSPIWVGKKDGRIYNP
ncbi:MAG: hypothetical protein ACYTG0_40355 [Planctomycetota bacterium]|jgi:hypothetical protein